MRNNVLVLEPILVLEIDDTCPEFLFFVDGRRERNCASTKTVDKATGKTAGLE